MKTRRFRFLTQKAIERIVNGTKKHFENFEAVSRLLGKEEALTNQISLISKRIEHCVTRKTLE